MCLELGFTMQQGEVLNLPILWGCVATNPSTRAELAAIASALLHMGHDQEQDEIIAIDSQASICMITKFMDSLPTL